jgi:hypothetical protein
MQSRSPDDGGEDGDENDIVDEEDDIDIEEIRAKRNSFLDSFTASNLDQMERVSSFLKDLTIWVTNSCLREFHINGPFSAFGILHYGSHHHLFRRI